MSNYIVSARKYRPMTFNAVVGQEALTTTLKNSISSGKLAHAYLFCGPRGVGKTTCARIFAKTINCENRNEAGEACDQCESCQAFNEQRSLNIHELDAASNNSVDDMRQLIEQVQVPPQIGRYKVFIIDEVHMLTTAAFNAFLKTSEEPPAHAIFILATTEKHKIPATILSRCQTYDFKRMDVPETVAHLKFVAEKEGVTYEEDALNLIAQKADGGMRDALSIFDQVASFTNGNITYQKVIEDLNILDYDYYFRLTDQCLAADVKGCMLTLDDILAHGFQGNHFMSGLANHFRSLLVARDPQTLHLLEGSDNLRQRYAEQAKRCAPRMLFNALRICNQCDLNYRQSNNKRLLVELTLIQVAQLSDTSAEDAPGSGLGPTKRLKPIFQALMAAVSGASTTPQPQQTQEQTAPASVQKTETTATSQPAAPNEQQKPAELYSSHEGRRRVSISRPLRGQNDSSAQQPTGTTPAQEDAHQEEVHNTPFNSEHFTYQWNEFIGSMPIEERAYAERMRAMKPVVKEGSNEVEVVVQNQRVKAYMDQLLPRLHAHLRSKLNNSLINVTFTIDQTQLQTVLHTPQEILKAMKQENKELDTLIDKLKLEIC